MTNLFLEEMTYLTINEYRSSGWTISNDSDIKIYVRKAEQIIDNIIISYWKKKDSAQNTIFPVEIEDIPLNIKKACFKISEYLFKNKDRSEVSKLIISESRRWKSVTYDTNFQDKYKMIHSALNEEIYMYLKPYIKVDKTLKSNFFRT